MIYFLVLPARKFIHMHCIRPRGMLNGNTCDHPRCSLLYFNPYFPPLSYTLFLFCTSHFECISIARLSPALICSLCLHCISSFSLRSLCFRVYKTVSEKCTRKYGWIATAASCLSVRGQFPHILLRSEYYWNGFVPFCRGVWHSINLFFYFTVLRST